MSYIPSVSVVVPAYNAAATLQGCLAALKRQSYPRERWDLVVVDNGSHDDTGAIAAAARVRVVHEATRGAASARNRGIAETDGEVVAFTDADCVADPEWLAQLVQPLQDETVGVAGGPFRALYRGTAMEQFGERIHDQEKAICLFRPPYVATANWASPRVLLRECGGFDAALLRGQDVDLAWRIVQRGKRLVYRASALVQHHNIRSLRGLFCQGLLHGCYSVALHRKHAAFLRQYGYQRVSGSRYRQMLSNLWEFARSGSPAALCALTFYSGRMVGKAVGSARYQYVDL